MLAMPRPKVETPKALPVSVRLPPAVKAAAEKAAIVSAGWAWSHPQARLTHDAGTTRIALAGRRAAPLGPTSGPGLPLYPRRAAAQSPRQRSALQAGLLQPPARGQHHGLPHGPHHGLLQH